MPVAQSLAMVFLGFVALGQAATGGIAERNITVRTLRAFERPNANSRFETVFVKGNNFRYERRLRPPNSLAETTSFVALLNSSTSRVILMEPGWKTFAEVDGAVGTFLSSLDASVTLSSELDPNVRVRDTGNRKNVGGLIARELVKEVWHGSSLAERQSGWYVDLPCSSQTDQSGRCVTYPVEVSRQLNVPSQGTVTERVTLLQISTDPIDASLFTIEPSYRRALRLPSGGFDFRRPDTLLNRGLAYWEQLTGRPAGR